MLFFFLVLKFFLMCFTAEPKDEIFPKDANLIQTNANATDDNMMCTFGTLKLSVGDKIKSEKYCVECGCSIPPMAHCVQNGHC